ncbi:Predicted oxidoreductase [Ruegeria intermedia]|uniref:Predicted oxidoreductase n=1 Tax=Ruegeria intermedia TaxID=996115 RepID=A0A1M4Y6K6_9RHOB|nr:aldo/keto reductase [Ruegeria intermedia]SHF01401.1 Predicted oxidoreductase [Ruegeria intermedia]
MTQYLTTLNGAPVRGYAFGTMQFGGRADADQSREMFDACRAAGIRHFDTAYVYADGASETLLGQMIAPERDDLLIATKVGYTGGAGAANIESQFEISRARLGQDVIDLLYLHRFDPETDLAETMECFARLKQAGKIRYVGLSNFAAWQVMKAARVAAQFDLTIDALQPMYNLVKRQAEVEILPMCSDQGIAVFSYSPLGGGLLTGKYARGGGGRLAEDERYASRYGAGWMAEAATRLAELAAEIGVDPATLAVAWVAASPYHPMPIISARNAEQLAPSLAALSHELSPELYQTITSFSPTPPPATDRLEEQT